MCVAGRKEAKTGDPCDRVVREMRQGSCGKVHADYLAINIIVLIVISNEVLRTQVNGQAPKGFNLSK